MKPDARQKAVIMATVYLRSESGRSLLGLAQPPTDPAPFLPSAETVAQAAEELRRLGFTIEAQGASLSISGPPELFERVFETELSFERVKGPGGRWLPRIRSARPVLRVEGLEHLIEGVVLATAGAPL